MELADNALVHAISRRLKDRNWAFAFEVGLIEPGARRGGGERLLYRS